MLVLLYHRSVNIIYISIYISVTRSHMTESRYENNIGGCHRQPLKRQKRITMTQLRRNTRPKCSKKRGRKGTLAEDKVEAAPDARDRKVINIECIRWWCDRHTHTDLDTHADTDTDTHTQYMYTCKYRTVPSLPFRRVPFRWHPAVLANQWVVLSVAGR